MTTLERCPFCGFEDTEIRADDNRHFFIFCNCCECQGPSSPTKRRAVGSWNLWRDKSCDDKKFAIDVLRDELHKGLKDVLRYRLR